MEYDYNIELNVEPTAKGRPRFTSRGHCYTPSKTRKAEKFIHEMVQSQFPGEPLLGALAVRLIFYLKRPKHHGSGPHCKNWKDYPTVKPDLDNLMKLIKDACSGVLWVDDSQICQSIAYKEYAIDGKEPSVYVSVAVLKPF